jgi:hypothetical protein
VVNIYIYIGTPLNQHLQFYVRLTLNMEAADSRNAGMIYYTTWCNKHPTRSTSDFACGWWRSAVHRLLTHQQPAKRAGAVQIKLHNRLLLNWRVNYQSGNMII